MNYCKLAFLCWLIASAIGVPALAWVLNCLHRDKERRLRYARVALINAVVRETDAQRSPEMQAAIGDAWKAVRGE